MAAMKWNKYHECRTISMNELVQIERNNHLKNPSNVMSMAESAHNYIPQVSTQATNMVNKDYNVQTIPYSHLPILLTVHTWNLLLLTLNNDAQFLQAVNITYLLSCWFTGTRQGSKRHTAKGSTRSWWQYTMFGWQGVSGWRNVKIKMLKNNITIFLFITNYLTL